MAETGVATKGCDFSCRIRSMGMEELPEVLEIERMAYSHPWTEAVFRDCFRDNYRLWSAEKDGALIGYAVVANLFDEAHLLNLCVHPGLWGRSVGRGLLQHVLAEASRENMCQMLLEVRSSNRPAIRLYSGEGFEDIGCRPEYYPGPDGREDARVMVFRFPA